MDRAEIQSYGHISNDYAKFLTKIQCADFLYVFDSAGSSSKIAPGPDIARARRFAS